MASPGFWDRQEEARRTIARSKELKTWTEPWTRLSGRVDDLLEMSALLADAGDDELESEVEREAEQLDRELEKLEFRNMLRGPDAHRAAASLCQSAHRSCIRRSNASANRSGADASILR